MLEILKKVIDAQNCLYDACDLKVANFLPEQESSKYHAHCYCLGIKNVRFRIAKKTPTKTGWFVTIWKRGADGIIAPYDQSDLVDFFVVGIVNHSKIGQFIFPKSVLLEKNIFSENGKGGKRAVRIYSPWDDTISSQAAKTKKWQGQYFIDLTLKNSKNITRMESLFS